jgi:hypothetical protein
LILVVGEKIALKIIHPVILTRTPNGPDTLVAETLHELVAGSSTDGTSIRRIVVVVQITTIVTFPMHYRTIYIPKTPRESISSVRIMRSP